MDGRQFPHVRLRSVGEPGPPHGIGVESVTVNPPLDERLFLPPAAGS